MMRRKRLSNFQLSIAIAATGLMIKLLGDYLKSRPRVLARLMKATQKYNLQEEKVRDKLSEDQIRRRAEANELDGFPSNALLES